MARRLIVPILFAAGFLAVFLPALSLLGPIFVNALADPIAPGQALRAAIMWTLAHLGIPALGALFGAWVAHAIARRRRPPPVDTSPSPKPPTA